jgi:hypothetical protein
MRRRITIKYFLFLFITPVMYLHADGQSSDTIHNTFKVKKTLILQGIVTDSKTHKVIRYVGVKVLNHPELSVSTDSSGAFNIPIPDNYHDFPIKLKFSCLCYKDLKLSVPSVKITASTFSINMVYSKKECSSRDNPRFL